MTETKKIWSDQFMTYLIPPEIYYKHLKRTEHSHFSDYRDGIAEFVKLRCRYSKGSFMKMNDIYEKYVKWAQSIGKGHTTPSAFSTIFKKYIYKDSEDIYLFYMRDRSEKDGLTHLYTWMYNITVD